MDEKEREVEGEGEPEKEGENLEEQPLIDIEVTIHNKYLGKMKAPKGVSLKDLLVMVGREFNVDVSRFQVVLDGRMIDLKKENPILMENSTLALIQKIQGGHS